MHSAIKISNLAADRRIPDDFGSRVRAALDKNVDNALDYAWAVIVSLLQLLFFFS